MYLGKESERKLIAIPSDEELAGVFKLDREKGLLIQQALEQQRIRPYFQPIADAAGGGVRIHELLMRLELDGEIVVANEFIGVAERMGLVHRMDQQLIEQACREMNEQGYAGMLFVNLSPKVLSHGEFMPRLHQAATAARVAPARLVFEIREMETVGDLGLLESFVGELKALGYGFAIDKFGFGPSAFQYLRRLPVDYIKIDGEFIAQLAQNRVYRAFVKGIVAIAQELGIKTVALCVEDAAVLAAVRGLGIDLAQGFHVGRPAPAIAKT